MSLGGLLTAERERGLRREHARMHPDGLTRSGLVCDVCLLLAALKETWGRIPRCERNTVRGYRCAKASGHRGSCSHPNDQGAHLPARADLVGRESERP